MRLVSQLCLLALLALTTCTSLDYPLNVTLTWTGKTAMQLVIQNVGESDLTLVTAGSFFDNRPVKKVAMYSDEGTVLAFRGMAVEPKPITALVAVDFTTVHVGQAFSVTFDPMTMYDLTSAANFTAEAAGAIWDAQSADFIAYKSNSIEIAVSHPEPTVVKRQRFKRQSEPLLVPFSTSLNPALAASLPTSFPRDKILDDCDLAQRTKIRKGLSACRLYAGIGANLSWNDPTDTSFGKFDWYFKSTVEADRQVARDRLNETSKECGAFFHPSVFISCQDAQKKCHGKDGTMLGYYETDHAYEPTIYLCPLALELQIASHRHNTMDLAGYFLSQHTLFREVYGPPVKHEYQELDKVIKLDTVDALMNSGTYRMFAQAGYLDKVNSLNGGKGSDNLNSPDELASPMDWNNMADYNDTDCAYAGATATDCWDPPDGWDGERYAEPTYSDNTEFVFQASSTGTISTTSTTSTPVSTPVSTTQFHITQAPSATASSGGCFRQFSDSPCEPEPTTMPNDYCWSEPDGICPP